MRDSSLESNVGNRITLPIENVAYDLSLNIKLQPSKIKHCFTLLFFIPFLKAQMAVPL